MSSNHRYDQHRHDEQMAGHFIALELHVTARWFRSCVNYVGRPFILPIDNTFATIATCFQLRANIHVTKYGYRE